MSIDFIFKHGTSSFLPPFRNQWGLASSGRLRCMTLLYTVNTETTLISKGSPHRFPFVSNQLNVSIMYDKASLMTVMKTMNSCDQVIQVPFWFDNRSFYNCVELWMWHYFISATWWVFDWGFTVHVDCKIKNVRVGQNNRTTRRCQRQGLLTL